MIAGVIGINVIKNYFGGSYKNIHWFTDSQNTFNGIFSPRNEVHKDFFDWYRIQLENVLIPHKTPGHIGFKGNNLADEAAERSYQKADYVLEFNDYVNLITQVHQNIGKGSFRVKETTMYGISFC